MKCCFIFEFSFSSLPHFSSPPSLCLGYEYSDELWCDYTVQLLVSMVVAKALRKDRARQAWSSFGVCFLYFFPHLCSAAAHADVAVVLYKALMICESITTPFGCTASTKYYWGGDPDWRNVHINYFYSNELKEVVERQRKSHEYMHNVNMQKGYRQGECFLHSAWDKQAH